MTTTKDTTILIVDDNVDFHTIATAMLKQLGYRVRSFFKGSSEIVHAIATSCDIVLLDVDLPGENGVEISKVIKSDPKCANIPIILISGNADLDLCYAQSKADACLLKPFSVKQLIEKVESFLAKLPGGKPGFSSTNFNSPAAT